MPENDAHPLDCLIVGAGPGGLTAAVYLARYRRRLAVVDRGGSRAALIPLSHNLTGYPQGLSGEKLLRRLRAQAAQYGAQVRQGEVLALHREAEVFEARLEGGEVLHARTVLLATGIKDHEPDPAIENWEAAVKHGSIRLCPICDGYEVADSKVGIIATDSSRVEHALFMLTYTSRLTLFCHNPALPLSAKEKAQLEAARIAWVDVPIARIEIGADMKPAVLLADGGTCVLDALYPMLGETAHAKLATGLGAQCADDGRLVVTDRQMTSVPGLYAAGDIVNNLNQISVACGQAAIAATAIHNRLRPHAAA